MAGLIGKGRIGRPLVVTGAGAGSAIGRIGTSRLMAPGQVLLDLDVANSLVRNDINNGFIISSSIVVATAANHSRHH